jgi:glycosyltransferase involved in cell wall biosynthesis
MKILFYCDHFKEYTATLLSAFPRESAETAIILRANTPEFVGRRDDELALHSILDESCGESLVLTGGYRSVEAAAQLLQFFQRRRNDAKYDVFHLQSTYDPRFLWLAWRTPTVLTVHEPGDRLGLLRQPGWRGAVKHRIRGLYRRLADALVVHTDSGLAGLTPDELRKSIVIPHGVHTRDLGRAGQSRTILFFGRIASYKGLDVLLDAMNIVWTSIPDAQLQILASPGDDWEGRDSAVYDPRVQANWAGYTKHELESALSQARAVCIPYLSASGSGVAAEAIGAGRLVVASDLEDLRGLVSHPDLLAEPGCPKDLARALCAALSNDYEPKQVDTQRAWPEVARAHLRVYQDLVGDLGGARHIRGQNGRGRINGRPGHRIDPRPSTNQ